MCRQLRKQSEYFSVSVCTQRKGLQFRLRMINENRQILTSFWYLMFCMFVFRVCLARRLEEINEIQICISLSQRQNYETFDPCWETFCIYLQLTGPGWSFKIQVNKVQIWEFFFICAWIVVRLRLVGKGIYLSHPLQEDVCWSTAVFYLI